MREELQEKRSTKLEVSLPHQVGATRQTLLWAELIEVAAEPCALLIVEDVTQRRDWKNNCSRPRKWRPWANWRPAWLTISTTFSP